MPTNAPPKPARLTGPERSEQLLDVAEALFMAKGYDRTSIGDIARAAGISRPIVYEHHGSKEGVYVACVARARRRLLTEYRQAFAGLGQPLEVLRASATAWFSIVDRDPDRWMLLYGGTAVPLTGDLGRAVLDERAKNIDVYVRAVRRWVRPDIPVDRVAAVAQMISGVGEQLARWWLTNRHVSLDEVVGYYVDFCWNGLAPLMDPK